MSTSTPPPELDIDSLRAIKLLGQGATGTVLLVHHHPHPLAVKFVERSKSSDRRARRELAVLRRLSSSSPHPFLPHLIAASETPDLICWAVPYCPGGDLNVLRHHQNDGVFSPAVIRFYLAEIVCALDHLHSMGVVYRDLKPENILVQQSGHVTLTDFDLSRDLSRVKSVVLESQPCPGQQKPTRIGKNKNKNNYAVKKAKSARVSPVSRRNTEDFAFSTNERSNSFVGTEEYVAPEVVLGDGHEFAVDWWALGVLCYEMLYGATPFKGRNRKETFRNILLAEPAFVGRHGGALTDLIRKLLIKDPTRRLGFLRGASEIKEHEFFKGLRWDLLTEVSRPPFLPLKDETEELTGGGVCVKEYFEIQKLPPSPLWSPSHDECRGNYSLTEF